MNRSIISYLTEENNNLKNLQDKATRMFSFGKLNPFKLKDPKQPNIPKPKTDSNGKPLSFDSFKKD